MARPLINIINRMDTAITLSARLIWSSIPVTFRLFSRETLLAAAGEPDIAAKLKQGYDAGKSNFKVYLDGVNLLPYWKGEVKENPRPGFLYWSDDGDLMAIRYGHWKVHFAVQRSVGSSAWQDPFENLRLPMLVNLRSDPFEQAEISSDVYYAKWRTDRAFMLIPAGALVGQYMQTLVEFPPRQRPASFTIGDVMEKLRRHKEALESGSGVGVK
jgi:hypothetical protein